MSRRYVKLWVDLWDKIGNPTDWMLFLYLLQRAEVKGNSKVSRGQILTSWPALAKNLQQSQMAMRRSMGRLIDLGYVDRISDRLGTRVTICNYNKYNGDKGDLTNQLTPSEEELYIRILADLDERLGTSYQNRKPDEWIKLFNGRRKEKAVLADFLAVNEVKCKDWLGTDYAKFLTPSTLWRPSKFWNYRESAKVVGKKKDMGVDDLL